MGSGLLSADTVWRVLRDLRERPGAPLLLIRSHIGHEADVYALTTQNVMAGHRGGAERIRIEPVHDAWYQLGLHLRRIYELVALHGICSKDDLYAAASVPRSTGDDMIRQLCGAGLLVRAGAGQVERGESTPDDVVRAHRLGDVRTERCQRYRAQREQWHDWLAQREQVRNDSATVGASRVDTWPDGADEPDWAATWTASLMANGPPDDDHSCELEAITMLAELLGARLIG